MFTELLLILLGLLVCVWTYRWSKRIGNRSSQTIVTPEFVNAYTRTVMAAMFLGALLVFMGVFMWLDVFRFSGIMLP
jgi:hypothetical protein